MRELAIGICQLTSEIGSADHDPRPANLEKATRAIAETAHQGAKLIVFGEIYLNGYETNEFTPLYAIAESEDDPYVAHLIEAAQQHDAHIIMGASTHKGAFPGQSYNSALLIGPTGLIGVYSKTHVASFAFDGRVAAEKAWWCPGGEIPVFDTPLGRIGIEICYDNSFPEVSRTLTLKGAEIIVNISAAVAGFEDHWSKHLYVRSTENVIWFLHVSLVGRQRDFDLFGWSRIFSPKGDVVFEAPRNEEAVAVARIDLDELYRARGQMAPFYNRNPELYRVIAES
ncbi:MAG TPA: carbon-nitrogen hydrolase family protein [Gaiellaceae bacterium]|nr:carbon-nitrogen hydrolase family protein [Gaiellaceae bacterium]